MITKKELKQELWDLKEELKAFRDNFVFCKECGVAVLKDRAYLIEIERSDFPVNSINHNYYCGKHKPNYDKRVIDYGLTTRYYKNQVEVSEKGKIKINKGR